MENYTRVATHRHCEGDSALSGVQRSRSVARSNLLYRSERLLTCTAPGASVVALWAPRNDGTLL